MSDSGAASSPKEIERLFQAALAHHQAGRIAEAVEGYEQVVAIAPTHYSSNLNLGVALRRLKRPEQALAAYDRAVQAQPGNAGVHFNRANLLRELRRYDEALASYDRALEIVPNDAATQRGRAGTLQDLQRLDEALAAFDAALALDPDSALGENGLGTVLFVMGRLDEALVHYERAIALEPTLALAHRNRGVVLRRLRRPHEAIAAHDRALELDPKVMDTYWYRSIVHLLVGNFEVGWRDYERRWEVDEFVSGSAGESTPTFRRRFRTNPTVDDVRGRKVLLIGEQGVGDVIMFASVLPDLLADAGSVALLCEPRLRALLSHAFPAVTFLDRAGAEAGLDGFDVVMAIGSLPWMYRRRVEDFPGAPYLAARPEIRRRWAERLGPSEGRKRVGVSWRGGVVRTGRETRSIPLAELKPVLDLPGCEFVSLQYGAHDEEIAAVSAGLERPIRTFPKDEVSDFEDLAALVAELDLVVSVQTSIVHLSGAVGAPALVMVPVTPEWRYLNAGTTMPWYRSIKLFRQGADADWGPVIARVADEAAERLGVR